MTSRYASFLQSLGYSVLIGEDGSEWFNYNGVLQPACLPAEVPANIGQHAKFALRKSGQLLVRWHNNFDKRVESGWWYVIRDGNYNVAHLSGNTRSKINRGKKRLIARKLGTEEVARMGFAVCKAAVGRYGSEEFLPAKSSFELKVKAAENFSDCFEFWGVLRDDSLVALCENHIQGCGIFTESIWYDPDALADYSSYVLMDAILNEFLNVRNLQYVSDGSRSIYHETGVHEFLITKFGFRRAYCDLNVRYSPIFGAAVACLRPFGDLMRRAAASKPSGSLKKLGALCLQDSIARGSLDV